mmetsp:Transcript_77574/g.146430  ORF Transcript_77574/g.146430 Transcript_77574/m.146430 type:complete len:836 (-) Transcript_77574:122-2629(-)
MEDSAGTTSIIPVPDECKPSRTSIDLATKGEDHNIRPLEVIAIFLACAVPSFLVIGLLSDVGAGIKFYSAMAPAKVNTMGTGIVSLGTFYVCLLIVLDWLRWKSKGLQAFFGLVGVYVICGGGFLKSRWYPQAPLVIILSHIPATLGFLRMVRMRKVRRDSFYHAATACLVVVAFICLIVWLVWIFVDGFDGNNQYGKETKNRLIKDSADIYKEFKYEPNGKERSINYWLDCDKLTRISKDPITGEEITSLEKEERGSACACVKTIWFLSWVSPFIAFGINLVIAAFCVINGSYLDPDTSKLEKVLKRFILLVCVLVMCGWCSASVGAASMRLSGVLMAFCGAGLFALIIWVLLRVGVASIVQRAATSKGMKNVMDMAANDWSRGFVVIGFGVMMPWFLFLNILNQRLRKARGTNEDHDGWFTKEAEPIVRKVVVWPWGSVLVKANRLVQLYFTMSIGITKYNYVFLSWLNQTLLKWSFPAVIVTFFGIGLTMFMLPPVPGVPVYILSGILIAARARTESVGYGGGIVIAILLSFVLKLMAVSGQYTIGFMAGKSVKIQKVVGVDQVLIRAIERILKTTGINLPKVAVLVGGPDWPTSVLCGILRLSLFQCLLGTCPVILVSSPCVLAGAFMAGPDEPGEKDEGKSGIWDTLASTMLGVSMMLQLASGVLAAYFTQEVVSKCQEELAKPRPEHEPVAELTRKEAAMVACYAEVTKWDNLPLWARICLFSSNVTLLSCLFFFMFMEPMWGREFQIKNSIDDDYDDMGLEKKWWTIVRPLGYMAMAVFGFGCFLDYIFCKWASCTTASRMKNGFSVTDAGASEPTKPPEVKEAWECS